MMRLTLLTIVFSMLAAPSLAQRQDVPPKIARFLKQSERSRRGAILQVEHALRGLHNQSPQTQDSKQQIASLENQLHVLESRSQPVVPSLYFPLQISGIGRLPKLSGHVEQIIAADEMLLRCYFPVVVTTVEHFRARRETVTQPVRVVLRGISTDKAQEGSDLELLQVFEVAGRETYRGVDGRSVEVFVLSTFDLREAKPYFEAMKRDGQ